VAPTRQLAWQAAAKARLYGIPAVDLTGSHTKWNPADEVRFRQGDAVAFVTYSAVFNASPYITAQTLVLDDAHAAEGPVAANWSIRIRRGDRAFPVVLDILAGAGAVPADVLDCLDAIGRDEFPCRREVLGSGGVIPEVRLDPRLPDQEQAVGQGRHRQTGSSGQASS
jgi:hypothetical protein